MTTLCLPKAVKGNNDPQIGRQKENQSSRTKTTSRDTDGEPINYNGHELKRRNVV